MRLIELEAAIKTACDAVEHYPSDWAVIEAAMRALPVAEERKHGHWINGYKCSVCGMHRAIDNGAYRIGTKDNKYCFRCGATMDEEV